MQQLVPVVRHNRLSGRPGWPAGSRLRRTTRTNCCIYTLLPTEDGLLESPKHLEV
jgi:hypothetical protein